MIAIVIFFFTLFLIYFGLCVEKSEASYQGRMKVKLIHYFNLIYSYFPSPIKRKLNRLFEYSFYEPNPIVQVVYVMLVLGLYYLFTVQGTDIFLENNDRIPKYYLYVVNFLTINALISFYIGSISNPGTLNKKNIKILSQYRKNDFVIYDNIIKPTCTKCNLNIIARSKHCYICKICVDKFDHHCIWLNNCIGSNNYRYFIWYLISHLLLTTIAFTIGSLILFDFIEEKNLFQMKFINKFTGEHLETNVYTIIKYITFHYYSFFSGLIMLFAISVILIVFLGYHIYLIKKNYTSNEINKRSKIKRFYELVHKTILLYKEKNPDEVDFSQFDNKVKEVQLTEDLKKKYKLFCNSDMSDITKLDVKELYELFVFSKYMIDNSYINIYDKGFISNSMEVFNGTISS